MRKTALAVATATLLSISQAHAQANGLSAPALSRAAITYLSE